jgi:hypothetical protein
MKWLMKGNSLLRWWVADGHPELVIQRGWSVGRRSHHANIPRYTLVVNGRAVGSWPHLRTAQREALVDLARLRPAMGAH